MPALTLVKQHQELPLLLWLLPVSVNAPFLSCRQGGFA